MGIAYNTSQVIDGLVFALDAGNTRSYSGSGITLFDLYSGTATTLINGVGTTTFNSGAFVFDGSNDYINPSFPVANNSDFTMLKAYINGAQQSLSYNGTIPSTAGTGASLLIGNTGPYSGPNSNLYSTGNLGSFQSYNRALSAAEVRQNYNSTKRRYL